MPLGWRREYPAITASEYTARLRTEVALSRYAPRDGLTFCDEFVGEVATWFGFRKFLPDEIKASDMVKAMRAGAPWLYVKMLDGYHYAGLGHLVVAGYVEEPHGHVAIVLPDGLPVWSDKWKVSCPLVANVGAKNGVMGLNLAFKVQPELFLYQG